MSKAFVNKRKASKAELAKTHAARQALGMASVGLLAPKVVKKSIVYEYGKVPLHLRQWNVSIAHGQQERWFWHLSDPSGTTLAMDRLCVRLHSNSLYPFEVKVQGGWVGMTQKQMQHVVAEWLRYTTIQEEEG